MSTLSVKTFTITNNFYLIVKKHFVWKHEKKTMEKLKVLNVEIMEKIIFLDEKWIGL